MAFHGGIPVSSLLSYRDRAREAPRHLLLSHQWNANYRACRGLFRALSKNHTLDLRNLSNKTVIRTRVCRWWVLCLINQRFSYYKFLLAEVPASLAFHTVLEEMFSSFLWKVWTSLVMLAAASELISWFQLSFVWLLSVFSSVSLKKKEEEKKDQPFFKVPVLDLL